MCDNWYLDHLWMFQLSVINYGSVIDVTVSFSVCLTNELLDWKIV